MILKLAKKKYIYKWSNLKNTFNTNTHFCSTCSLENNNELRIKQLFILCNILTRSLSL